MSMFFLGDEPDKCETCKPVVPCHKAGGCGLEMVTVEPIEALAKRKGFEILGVTIKGIGWECSNHMELSQLRPWLESLKDGEGL